MISTARKKARLSAVGYLERWSENFTKKILILPHWAKQNFFLSPGKLTIRVHTHIQSNNIAIAPCPRLDECRDKNLKMKLFLHVLHPAVSFVKVWERVEKEQGPVLTTIGVLCFDGWNECEMFSSAGFVAGSDGRPFCEFPSVCRLGGLRG